MHVVWKRPDGFHGADPSDFTVVELGTQAKLWLHKRDHTWFPFRISGGWQESDATKRLNNLVNLLGKPDSEWVACLAKMYNDTMGDDPAKFFGELDIWLEGLKSHLKGDTWELEIMSQAVTEVRNHLAGAFSAFLKASKA